ncbi:cob(I)yrinic acid a,c-diamide adenosyltransferase [candidate division KSB1 bacterium]|nr:cob(I)yrinic acid a,c-diamide adenosyltransferase [candidate division KSB1 bacterium]NIR70907.1 cob(I)yrinic acid a,c-diamide adenosyltransferase [candidate division KSB1 bacterium]NIS23079.1 cob(I)yrinic acid a,c-diamide adenosyltransferase [candidate division KSB1 bacterium]NIT69914.1 cob(I)yrinic acid a,c-diamide adenosyltransferase [candidate division KSB1 bacterium]NIU23580.1 cob(I)yrinic acid a,c-diamide adenosyltransferase [candidate division KSB1 bacterium]
MKRQTKGLIIVNTGNGKGKTTAALGVAFRASGNGMKVRMIQFIKGKWKTGELKAAEFFPNFKMSNMGKGFTWNSKKLEEDLKMIHEAWDECVQAILSGEFDVVIMDEINYVIDYEFLTVEEVLEVLAKKPPEMHVILTGRNAHPRIIEAADLVTEMKLVKHPYKKGIPAQQGIEF